MGWGKGKDGDRFMELFESILFTGRLMIQRRNS